LWVRSTLFILLTLIMSDRASPPPSPIPTSQQIEVHVKEEELTTLPSPTASVAKTEPTSDAPPHSPTRPARKTEGQRKAFLRNDVQVQEVEPWRVLCRVCERWIKLSATSYAANNWLAHKQRCSPATPILRAGRHTPSKPSFSPSSRVATAERKIVLFNDPQVKVFSPRRVQCGNCMSVVVLEGTVDYELTKWTEHKETCIPMTITPRGPASHRLPNPTPPSTQSQERSPSPPVESPAVIDSPKVGMKRDREQDEDEDERPKNRPRTIGWLMEPLKEFARGFRQGLGST